jgi:hypothetical protein
LNSHGRFPFERLGDPIIERLSPKIISLPGFIKAQLSVCCKQFFRSRGRQEFSLPRARAIGSADFAGAKPTVCHTGTAKIIAVRKNQRYDESFAVK